MDKLQRDYLKALVDQEVRRRNSGILKCDPESLTMAARDADDLGHTELADVFRRIRDRIINPLLGEGWTVDRIEDAMFKHFERRQ